MIKLLPLLAAALVATSGAASASSRFSLNEVQDSSSLIELGTVVADGDGVVELYEYHGAQAGRLLGQEAVKAGANSDVKVPVGTTFANDLLAVIKVDGQVVAEQVVRLGNN